MAERPLTAKQEAFVRAYLSNGRNASAAYREAYKADGMSEASVNVEAWKLLQHPKIAPRLEEVIDRAAEKTNASAERVLSELTKMAFYDPADLVRTPIQKPEDIALLPEHVRRSIVGWGWDKMGNFTLKLADKRGSLELIGRHLGMFKDRLEHSGSIETLTKEQRDAAVRAASEADR
jgi:phage terminase small subunit